METGSHLPVASREVPPIILGCAALCYVAAGVFGFLSGRDLFLSIMGTTFAAVWAGIAACYWLRWPRRSFSPKDDLPS
jgi:hypothetical protein